MAFRTVCVFKTEISREIHGYKDNLQNEFSVCEPSETGCARTLAKTLSGVKKLQPVNSVVPILQSQAPSGLCTVGRKQPDGHQIVGALAWCIAIALRVPPRFIVFMA